MSAANALLPILGADLGFDLVGGLVVFVLAALLGFEVITKVPAALHTPLMSGSNAISGIILVGAILVTSVASSGLVVVLGLIATVLATINVVGGFVVTDRMLRMFGGKAPRQPSGGPGGQPGGQPGGTTGGTSGGGKA